MSDICIKAENISKRFYVLKSRETALSTLKALIRRKRLKKGLWVLKDVSFEIKKGEKIALIGRNGSGKTTLLRILASIYNKTSGKLKVEVEPKAIFKHWVGFYLDLSVIDNVYLIGAMYGMFRKDLEKRMESVLEMAELYHLRFSMLKELSVGQLQRLALSVFFQTPGDFLIFDEGLAFVDKGFVLKCEPYFQELFSSDKTVIATSQDNSFLKRYCQRALWLAEGHIKMTGRAEETINAYEQSLID